MDEMQKCNPKPITIKTESKHNIPAQSTRLIHATITVSKYHPTIWTIQTLPQFDERAMYSSQHNNPERQESPHQNSQHHYFPYKITRNINGGITNFET